MNFSIWYKRNDSRGKHFREIQQRYAPESVWWNNHVKKSLIFSSFLFNSERYTLDTYFSAQEIARYCLPGRRLCACSTEGDAPDYRGIGFQPSLRLYSFLKENSNRLPRYRIPAYANWISDVIHSGIEPQYISTNTERQVTRYKPPA